MSFTITITNVPDKELGPLIARLNLPRGVTHDIRHTPDHVGLIEAPKKAHATGKTRLTMTGKIPRASEILTRALTEFEKCEAKNGIGTVTVDMYRDYLTKKKLDPKLQTRLIHEGYLGYLE